MLRSKDVSKGAAELGGEQRSSKEDTAEVVICKGSG